MGSTCPRRTDTEFYLLLLECHSSTMGKPNEIICICEKLNEKDCNQYHEKWVGGAVPVRLTAGKACQARSTTSSQRSIAAMLSGSSRNGTWPRSLTVTASRR